MNFPSTYTMPILHSFNFGNASQALLFKRVGCRPSNQESALNYLPENINILADGNVPCACNFLFEGYSEFNFLRFKIIWQNGKHKGTLTVEALYETRKRVAYQKSVILHKQAGRRKRAHLLSTARFSLFGMMRMIRETAVTGGSTDLLGSYSQPPPALVMWVEDGGKV